MDKVSLLQGITRRLPPVRGSGRIADLLIKLFGFGRGDKRLVDAYGFQFELEASECVDSKVIFYPQIYERREFQRLESLLRPGDVFVDIGSNVGIYSVLASRWVGPEGRVVAFEADPYNYRKLSRNIALNEVGNITAVNMGVSDVVETAMLHVDTDGNRGGNSFLAQGGEGTVSVECMPLSDLLAREDLSAVQGVKIDVEGYEYKILKKFFEDIDRDDYPTFILFEYVEAMSTGNVVELLKQHGYRVSNIKEFNYIGII
ncbi:MAG: FkbM family methyltransferase [Gammaproteobacteria bacterium]|nr:FkbM family methyltransferase [Gammaproteobacteria bacterium]